MKTISQDNLISRARMFVINHRGKRLFVKILTRLLSESSQFLVWLLMLPVTLVGHYCEYRRLPVITSRIGHLAAEIDCFLKSKHLGDAPEGKYFILAPEAEVANSHILSYWRSHITVISHPIICWFLKGMTYSKFMRYEVKHYVLGLNRSQKIYSINRRWHPRSPLLKLTDEDRAWGENALEELGIPSGGWFVCVHAREPGFSVNDDVTHQYRNSDPKVLISSIKEIVKRGGICVRMGHPSGYKMLGIKGLIDYAHSPMRSDRLDVILCAKAKFFLGSTSGISLVSTVFGVPCALVNMTPISSTAVLQSDLSIPKLLYCGSENRYLTFPEIFRSNLSNFRYSSLYKELGVSLVENSSEDIKDLVVELLDELDNGRSELKETNLQRTYKQLLRPGHYGFDSQSRIGNKFLVKYQHLLFEQPQLK